MNWLENFPPFTNPKHMSWNTYKTSIYNNSNLMPSPSAFSRFVLSVLEFLGILKFFWCTQNSLGIFKWANLCREIYLLSIPKWFWVYIKNWACLKNLSMLGPNFEEADLSRHYLLSWTSVVFPQFLQYFFHNEIWKIENYSPKKELKEFHLNMWKLW